jgi:type II secretory pathway component GspD/PulD (secretin)
MTQQEIKEKIEKYKNQLELPSLPASAQNRLKVLISELESKLDKPVPAPKTAAPKKVATPAKKPAPAKKATSKENVVTVDGHEYNLDDCHEAIKAWDKRKAQVKESAGAYKTKPASQKVADNVETAVKQAADGVSKTRMENNPNAVIKGADQIKKAVEDLFKGFETMTGKKVSDKQRKEILAILLEVKEEARENK